MSEVSDNGRDTSEKSNSKMVGVHFTNDEETLDNIEQKEIRRKLHQASTSYREHKEVYDKLCEAGLKTEELIYEEEAKKKFFTNRLKKLQQQREQRKKMWEDEDEALHLQLLAQEDINQTSKLITKMEKEVWKLKNQNKDLTTELDYLRKTYQDKEDQNCRTVVQRLKHKLDEVQEVLQRKEDEIEKISRAEIKTKMEVEESVQLIEDLRKEQRELKKWLNDSQEKQIVDALKLQEESKTIRESLYVTDEEDEGYKDERALETEDIERSWWYHCVQGLWKGIKATGLITLCAVLSFCIMASVASSCNIPDPSSDLWSIMLHLLEPYGELSHTVPPNV